MDKDRLYGNCHCGTVQFSIPRNIDMSAARRCDCSLCKRRGAVMLACPIEDVKIETGAEHLVHYKWNTKVATHHFCSKCGIMTHHQRRTTPRNLWHQYRLHWWNWLSQFSGRANEQWRRSNISRKV